MRDALLVFQSRLSSLKGAERELTDGKFKG